MTQREAINIIDELEHNIDKWNRSISYLVKKFQKLNKDYHLTPEQNKIIEPTNQKIREAYKIIQNLEEFNGQHRLVFVPLQKIAQWYDENNEQENAQKIREMYNLLSKTFHSKNYREVEQN